MNEIEKIKRYIERTGVKYSTGSPYQMDFADMSGLRHMAGDDLIGALCLAFEYGRAKGERSARGRAEIEGRGMTEQEKRDLQEFRELWNKLSQQGKEKAAMALLAVVQEEAAQHET